MDLSPLIFPPGSKGLPDRVPFHPSLGPGLIADNANGWSATHPRFRILISGRRISSFEIRDVEVFQALFHAAD